MDERIVEMVKKYQIATFQDGRERRIRVDSSVARTPADVEYVKSHKSEIIQYLDSERDRRIAEEEAENREKYAELIVRLPERKIENTPDEVKFREALSHISQHHFSGKEDDGLNLALRASNGEAYREAGKYCNHKLETEYDYTYTQDARLKLVRTISCKKCQLYIRDIVEEHSEYNWN